MSRAGSIRGVRTLVFGALSLCVMGWGFWLIPPDGRAGAFVALVGGIGALMAAISAKSSVETLASGGGVRGAAAALMTSAKPEPPTGGTG